MNPKPDFKSLISPLEPHASRSTSFPPPPPLSPPRPRSPLRREGLRPRRLGGDLESLRRGGERPPRRTPPREGERLREPEFERPPRPRDGERESPPILHDNLLLQGLRKSGRYALRLEQK